jgi:Na+-translocating ferredoxin:NAD+ oxidoreductase RNF subunit RnfB
MTCPRCGYPGLDPRAQAAGRLGGRAKVPKGFADPKVLAKALATRRMKAQQRRTT